MNFQSFFNRGMKRSLPFLAAAPDVGYIIEVGAGKYSRAAGWVAELHWLNKELPDSVAEIHCYHFLEHLSGVGVVEMLHEFERVLVPEGVVNIVTPYYNSQLAAQDLDRRSQFCEETWRNIFANPYYADKGNEWKLRVHFCLIAGLVERNLALFTQLVKA